MTAMVSTSQICCKDCTGIPFDVCLAPSWPRRGPVHLGFQPLPSALGGGDPRRAGSRWECRAAYKKGVWVDLEVSGSLGASFNPHYR